MPASSRRARRIAELEELARTAPCFGVHAAAMEALADLLYPRGIPERRPTKRERAARRARAATLKAAAAAGRVTLAAPVARDLATYTWSDRRIVALWLSSWAALHGQQADTEHIHAMLERRRFRVS